jgi:regulator of protease activity HflC (stomatin/prohibitin superfamily)
MTLLAFLGAAASSIILALILGVVAGGIVFFLLSIGRIKAQVNRWVVSAAVGVGVSVIVLGAVAAGQAYTPVEHGTVALVVRFGGLTGNVFEPGLHWRTPFIDRIVVVPTVVQSYETSDNPDISGADYRDYPVTAQTVDGQQINIKYTVLFRMPGDKAADIVQNIGFVDAVVENVVKAHSRNLTRLRAQKYTAENLYSGEGIFDYENTVQIDLQEEFSKYGLLLDDFLVRKIDFDEEYTRAIEQQQIAQEAIETAKYESEAAEYEKERQIRLSEAEAERTKLLAQAEAERQRLLADAEAYSIQSRGEALKEFPEVVQWEFVRNLQSVQWGILPSEGLTPLVPLPSFDAQEETEEGETSLLPEPTPPPTTTQPPGEGE